MALIFLIFSCRNIKQENKDTIIEQLIDSLNTYRESGNGERMLFMIDSLKTMNVNMSDIAMEYDEGDENNPDYKKEEQNIIQYNEEEQTTIKDNKDNGKDESNVVMNILMTISSVVGVCLSVALFIWLPTKLCNLLKGVVPVLNNGVWQSVFEGVLKIIIFIAYIAICSLMEDMKRVFMYHGAEHKTIFCYEKGLELTVENVKEQIRFHPRCGTSFLSIMLIVGIFVGVFIPHDISTVTRTGIKLLCIPIIMGIGYEAIKLAGRKDNLFTRIMSVPGLWIQRITTKEPTDDMIECAITSFMAVLPNENN